jgi:ribonuclease III
MALITELHQVIQYVFKEPRFLQTALTHRSVKGNNNERLEFLGDSILNFLIAEALYKKFPQAKEGELSRLRAQLVKGETLADIAIELCLGQFLVLGQGERKSGGKYRKSILADTVEAIIGAIYMDSGDIQACQKQVLNWYASRLSVLNLDVVKDPKSVLQEYLQAKHYELPQYVVKSITGEDHAQVFTIHCQVLGIDYVGVGQETSRRRAEQEAAENFFVWIKNHLGDQ